MRLFRVLAAGLACVGVAACGSAHAAPHAATGAPRASHPLARWTAFAHVGRPLDVAGPRADGAIVLAAAGRLFLLERSGRARPFAPAYKSPGGEEPYVALSPGGCFGRDAVYALRLQAGPGVTQVTAAGRVRRFASIPTPGLLDAIAFGFGGRLLVTIQAGARTAVDAIDCRGRVHTITRRAPRMEGGVAVAPASFGRFAGDLIGPDERSGRIWAITPAGASVPVAKSGLPQGGDIGVESEGFVPAGTGWDALLADRHTPGNPHPGDDVVLSVPVASLGGRPGDLLVATEGGALTEVVSCARSRCSVRKVAAGPKIAHAEGHVAFARP